MKQKLTRSLTNLDDHDVERAGLAKATGEEDDVDPARQESQGEGHSFIGAPGEMEDKRRESRHAVNVTGTRRGS